MKDRTCRFNGHQSSYSHTLLRVHFRVKGKVDLNVAGLWVVDTSEHGCVPETRAALRCCWKCQIDEILPTLHIIN